MKILLIDDKANYGWKQLITKMFPFQGISIDTALDYDSALNQIENKYDIIFLDVRLSAEDHDNKNVVEFSGFKILKVIRKEFTAINFSTPIILLTATNKIWNIDAFRNYGVDAYYIKEHPNYIFDKETSKQNYLNLKENFNRLLEEGNRRNEIWYLSKNIINKVSSHYYFKGDKKYENVKNRIIDKIKLGFVYLFKEQTQIEKDLLKTNNEALAFIIYWSILEEIIKGYTEYNTWDSMGNFLGSWKFRNKEYFVEKLNNGNLKVNISKNEGKHFVKNYIEYKQNDNNFKKYEDGYINLSEQVYSLLAAYSKNIQDFNQKSREFGEINSFRNNVDFIHSNIRNIYEKELINAQDLKEHYDYCKKNLKFIKSILDLI